MVLLSNLLLYAFIVKRALLIYNFLSYELKINNSFEFVRFIFVWLCLFVFVGRDHERLSGVMNRTGSQFDSRSPDTINV